MNTAKAEARLRTWLEGLRFVSQNQGPARGTIAGALVVLEALKTGFDLKLERHLAPGGTQVKGASGKKIKDVLANFGEHRKFVSEGGRTNRGLRDEIASLLSALEELQFDRLDTAKRNALLTKLQSILVEQVKAFHDRQRIEFTFDPAKSSYQLIADVLQTARDARKDGSVAQYLVGAKLQLRYPGSEVENNNATTADDQLGRAGDYRVGDTAFHITVAPMPAVMDKCRKNLKDGFHAYLLVPHGKLEAARQMAGDDLASKIAVVSIESFVAQNIDELGHFRASERNSKLAVLLTLYNQRVDAVENDKSLLIDIPPNLCQKH